MSPTAAQALRVAGGTDLDFASYVAARRPALLGWARAVAGDPHTAEDLLQASLLRVLGRWDTLRDHGAADALGDCCSGVAGAACASVRYARRVQRTLRRGPMQNMPPP